MSSSPLAGIARQFSSFFGVGILAAVVHSGVLIGLVEIWRWSPVPASLQGYCWGGILSYGLNRKLTYRSDRPHAEATWRFALVALVGFVLTGAFMHVLTRWLTLPYVPAQLVTTGIVLFWSFVAHRAWTFGARPSPLPGRERSDRRSG